MTKPIIVIARGCSYDNQVNMRRGSMKRQKAKSTQNLDVKIVWKSDIRWRMGLEIHA
jgi:hypothetical protein